MRLSAGYVYFIITILIASDTDNPAQDSFVIYGGADLPETIALSNQDGSASFAHGFAIESLSSAESAFQAGSGGDVNGDVNGDGLADLVYSDTFDLDTDLTYAVHVELRSAAARTDYIDGTIGDDYILQKDDTKAYDAVAVIANAGGDFIQTLNGYTVLVYGGQGADKIGLGGVDSSKIVRIDGGNGTDVLFLDTVQTGSANTLDVTALKGRIQDIEVIDLGEGNALEFDFASVKSITGTGNTLIVMGTDAAAKYRTGTYNRWQKVGEDAHDGKVFNVFQYAYGSVDEPRSLETNVQIWLEKGGVSPQRLIVNSDQDESPTDGDDPIDGRDFWDTFVFRDGDGHLVIEDFQAGAGTDDALDLTDVSSVSEFADIVALAKEVDDHLLLEFRNDDAIDLPGVALSDLHADDFRFV